MTVFQFFGKKFRCLISLPSYLISLLHSPHSTEFILFYMALFGVVVEWHLYSKMTYSLLPMFMVNILICFVGVVCGNWLKSKRLKKIEAEIQHLNLPKHIQSYVKKGITDDFNVTMLVFVFFMNLHFLFIVIINKVSETGISFTANGVGGVAL